MMSGLTGLFFYLIDGVSIGVILIAVGLMIVQQALEVSPSRHYPCLMVGIMFVVADMIYFDHFNAGVGMATRSLGRMRGVSNMAPAGGIMCSLIVSWILCDLTDSNFVRGGVVAALASFLSLFGLMHGNNYVFSDGTVMSTDTGGDHYTTDQPPTWARWSSPPSRRPRSAVPHPVYAPRQARVNILIRLTHRAP